jgi:hypothetical protein
MRTRRPSVSLCISATRNGALMSRTIVSEDSNGHVNTLTFHEGDMAVLNLLKSVKSGEAKLTITAASVKGETIFVTQKNRIYEVQKKDLF